MNKKIKILLLEDNEYDVELVIEQLKNDGIKFEYQHIAERKNFLPAVYRFKPDIILADFDMNHWNALDALDILQQNKITIPLILVTGSQTEEIAVDCIKKGAEDYILKGSILRLATSIKQTLERRQNEIEKEKNYEQIVKLSSALEQSSDCVIIVNAAGNVEFINKKVNNYSDLNQGISEKLKITDLRTYIDNCLIDKKIWDAVKRESNWTTEVLAGDDAKKSVWFEISSSTVMNDEGEITDYIIIQKDITNRKHFEVALKESEELYRTLYESMAEGVVFQNSKGQITEVNKAAEKILGITFKEIKGKTSADPIWDCIHSDGTKFKISEHPAVKAFQTKRKVKNTLMGVYNPKLKEYKWIIENAIPQFKGTSKEPYRVFVTFEDITDLKRSSDELKSSEERLQIIFNYAPDAYYLTDENGVFVDGNQTAEKLAGYKKEELIGKRFDETNLVPVEQIAKINDHLKQNAEGRPAGPTEINLKNKNGTTINVEVSSFPVVIHGRPMILAQAHNITERKANLEKIRISEEKYRNLFEYAPVGIYQATLNGEIITANRTLASILDYNSEAELLAHNMKDFYYNADERNKIVEQIVGNELSSDIEIKWKKKNGEPVWVQLSAHAFKDKNDGKTLLEGFIYNITRRKEKEEEILKLSKAVESSPASIVITDREGTIEYVNRKFTEMTGYTFDEVKGKTPRTINRVTGQGSYFDNLWNRIAKGEEWRGEFLNRKKSGDYFWEYTSISPIKNESGEITHFVGVHEDLTEKKQREEELEEAKTTAEEMNRLKSIFLANMSHELRTPMIGVVGYAGILKELLKDQELINMAERILDSGNRLTSTMNLILDLSKIEAEKIKIHKSRSDIIKTTGEVIDANLKEAKAKKIFLSLNSEFKSLVCLIDQTLYYQITNNLVNNAIKYTDSGSVTVKVGISKINKRNLVLEVSDTGIGIPRDNVSMIFDPFRQVSEGLSRSHEGTGLGLTITKKFVELLNGKITVNSELGKGSTFIVTIPIEIEAYEEKKLGADDNDRENVHRLPKLLLVEDDPTSSEIINLFLKNKYDLSLVSGGAAAIELCSEVQFDLILMDINLRGIDGLETTKKIRQLASYSDTPIIAVTAYAMSGDREKFVEQGCSDYISKPFSKNELLSVIKKYMDDEKNKRS